KPALRATGRICHRPLAFLLGSGLAIECLITDGFQRSNRPKLADFALFRGVLPKFAKMMLARRKQFGKKRGPIVLTPRPSIAIELPTASNEASSLPPPRGGRGWGGGGPSCLRFDVAVMSEMPLSSLVSRGEREKI